MDSPKLQNLPAELTLQIFEDLSSPLDIFALASASPVTFILFNSNRRRILVPVIENLQIWLETPKRLSDAMLACRLRMITYNTTSLDPRQVEFKVRSILDSRPTRLLTCQISLGVICELSRLRSEAQEMTTRYGLQAWEALQNEAALYINRSRSQHHPFPRLPLVLSMSELGRLDDGFLQFEISRHCLDYDKTPLLATELSFDMKWCLDFGLTGPKPIIGCNDLNWDLRAFQSFFRFLFDEYRILIGRVQIQADIRRASQLASKGECQTQSQSKARQPTHDVDPTLLSAFIQRSLHEELRYASYLCSHGFPLLNNLQQISIHDLEHFLLTTFTSMRSSEASSNVAEKEELDHLGLSLEKFCIPVDNRHDPWLRGRYFWDSRRVDELRLEQRRWDFIWTRHRRRLRDERFGTESGESVIERILEWSRRGRDW
ncbi:hypothetical protein ACHAPI_009870 [Fusarium lateritium]